MSSIIRQHTNEVLNVFSCGITRVAFVKNAIADFNKKYGVKVETNAKGGVGLCFIKSKSSSYSLAVKLTSLLFLNTCLLAKFIVTSPILMVYAPLESNLL